MPVVTARVFQDRVTDELAGTAVAVAVNERICGAFGVAVADSVLVADHYQSF
jgi:hypothetical protein